MEHANRSLHKCLCFCCLKQNNCSNGKKMKTNYTRRKIIYENKYHNRSSDIPKRKLINIAFYQKRIKRTYVVNSKESL